MSCRYFITRRAALTADSAYFVIIQHDKARSASDRPATRDAQHPESGVLNSYLNFTLLILILILI
jgi:hypothetical protein